jgi:DNA-binding NarL/FixJ family response regulator
MSMPEARSTQRPIRSVLIVEDYPLVREGLVALLNQNQNYEVCGQAGDAETALKQLEALSPDIVFLDLRLGDVDGFDLIKQMRTVHPDVRILVISMHGEEMYAERSLAAGAVGYIMKSEPPERILDALEEIREGRIYVSHRISMQVLNRIKNPDRDPAKGIKVLTDRELQIFQLIGLGYQTRQIAQRLGIGVKTVETHRENIKTKLGLDHAVALVREATVWVRQQQ